jgi:hypothetical protein
MSPLFLAHAAEVLCHLGIGLLNHVHPPQQSLVGALLLLQVYEQTSPGVLPSFRNRREGGDFTTEG